MKRVILGSVMALTVAFASTAAADEGATAPSPPPPASAEQPLALRPSKPLTLAPEQTGSSWTIKAILGAIAIGAGFVAWKKRKNIGARNAATGTEVRIVTRTSVGMRGEIAVVEAGAMRLVVGITPSSMTTLAVLADDDAAKPALETAPEATTPRRLLADVLGEEDAPAPDARPRRIAARAAAARYLSAAGTNEDAIPPAPKRARRAPAADAPLEGQVRGLAFAMKKAR